MGLSSRAKSGKFGGAIHYREVVPMESYDKIKVRMITA